MNVIQNAVEKKWNICGTEQIDCQTWKHFKNTIRNRNLFVFGVGNAVDYFLTKYSKDYDIYSVIDNDPAKVGRYLKEFSFSKECRNDLKIYDESILDNYKQDEIVVLVLSIKQYIEIYNKLFEKGFCNVFSFIVMEAKTDKETWIDCDCLENEYIQTQLNNCPIKNNKIAVHSMGRVADHAKYIVEKCKKINNNLEIYWLVNEMPLKSDDGIQYVLKKNRKAVIDATIDAKIWLDDYLGAFWMEKRPGQMMIELKHWSSITLKTFGLTLERSRNVKSNIDVCLDIAKKIDYTVVGSEFDIETCKKGFGVDDNFIKLGSARTDILFAEESLSTKIKETLNISIEEKCLLYAPTFRTSSSVDGEGNRNIDAFYSKHVEIDYEFLKNNLEKKFGGKWKILLRLHPVLAKMNKNQQLPECVVDCSDYSDSQELISISDIVITDYSSIMFEPAYVLKPVFLFATDLESYLRDERKLLIDYKKLPFPIATNNEELSNEIQVFNYDKYQKDVMFFFKQYGISEDGHSSERTALFIDDIVKNQIKEITYYEKYLKS